LLQEGQSDSVIETPLDPDPEDIAHEQRVIAGEEKDVIDIEQERDNFDPFSDPLQNDESGLGDEGRDPVEW
jgi:hypothetical protein